MSEQRRANDSLAPILAPRGLAVRPGAQRGLVAQGAAERALVLSAPGSFAKRAVRVPTDALVSVAPPPVGRQAPLRLAPPAAPPVTANDNHAPPASRDRLRQTVREAVFLVILAATIAAAFYSGRQNAFQNVIVVPGPLSFGAVVT